MSQTIQITREEIKQLFEEDCTISTDHTCFRKTSAGYEKTGPNGWSIVWFEERMWETIENSENLSYISDGFRNNISPNYRNI